MRLLIVDHNALDPLGRRIYETLAAEWPENVWLLVPERWHDGYRMQRFGGEVREGSLEIRASGVLAPQRTHRMLYRDLSRELKRISPEMLFVNAEPENFQTWHAARLARRTPAMRFVFSTWRNIDHRLGGYPYRFEELHRRAERAVLARADHGIAFTPDAVEIYRRHGFAEMTHVPPAVDTELFFPSESHTERESLGLTEFTIGYAGRLVREKGVDDLLHASALCRFDHQLLIVGEGPERASLGALAAKLGISERIVWAGSHSRRRVAALINAMDVLVLPSRTGKFWKEQFGRVLIEAMACRVPVVGSSSGAIPAVIGNAGAVVEEGNRHALAAAVARLYDDRSLREDLAARGLQRARQRHAVPVIASTYRALFTSVLDSPRD